MRRVRRGGLWVRWALRDARRHRAQVLTIALLLALGVGMYASMSSMSVWRVASADASFEALGMHDLRFSLVEGSTVGEGQLLEALRDADADGDVLASAERLAAETQVDASQDGRAVIVPGRIVGTPSSSTVDMLALRRGVRPRHGEGVLLEGNFAAANDLPPSGALTLTGGRRVRYTGHAIAPESFIVTLPGAAFGAESTFAILFTSLSTAQSLAGEPGRVNELVLRLRPGADLQAAEERLSRAVRAALPDVGLTVTARHDEPAHRVIYEDAEGDQEMLDIFALLLLGAATLAAFNLVSRTVDAQRREIGVGMALGVEPRALARRPFLLAGQVAVAGVVLGVPVGLLTGDWLAGIMEDFTPLPIIRSDFQGDVFARGAALGLVLPLLAAAGPVWRALRVAPVEAVRVGARSSRRSGLTWIARGIRLPGGALANLPLRNVLRTPRRTGMTALGIAAVVTVVVVLAGVMDSFDTTLAESRGEALAGAPDRLTVDLATPAPVTAEEVRRVGAAASVGATQTSLRVPSALGDGSERIDVSLELVGDDTALWRPTFRDGALPAAEPGLLVARRASEVLGVGVGDRVTVAYPVPSGPGSFRLASASLPVTGVHTSPLRFVAYANTAAAERLGLAGLANRVSVVPAPGRTADDVKAELLEQPQVTAVQSAAATIDAVDERVEQFDDILLVTVLIASMMALLLAYNAAAINADERVRENATMLAHGVRVRSVVGGGVAEALLIGMLGTAVGLLAGHRLLRWVVETNMPETMPELGMLLSVSPSTYVLALAAGTVVVAAAPLLTARRLDRADIPGSLRVVE